MTVAAAEQALIKLDDYFQLESLPPGSPTGSLSPLFALRFAVFCEECNFLSPNDYPNGLESDDYDSGSAHFAARNPDHRVVGTSRLVLVGSETTFPYEAHCDTFANFRPPDRAASAEVSRLAVDRTYRRRAGDSLSGVNTLDLKGPRHPGTRGGSDKRVNAPLLVLGLYREMYRYSRANGIRYWYAAMEKPLAKVLAMYGFAFTPIGPEQDYYGPVTPYLGDLRDLEELVRGYKPELLEWFQNG